MKYNPFLSPDHVHCWHSVKAGHLTIQQCCRCKAERKDSWAQARAHARYLWQLGLPEVRP